MYKLRRGNFAPNYSGGREIDNGVTRPPPTLQLIIMASLSGRKIAAVLLDVTGVLYESGPHDGKVIEGSPEAVQK